MVLANKWGKEPWELGLFPEKTTWIDKMRWRYRWQLWMEHRAKWRNTLDYTNPGTLELVKLELLLNG